MKVGDLVHCIEGWPKRVEGQEGLIISGPRIPRFRSATGLRQWEVLWTYCNKVGYWDEFRLEVIDEAR